MTDKPQPGRLEELRELCVSRRLSGDDLQTVNEAWAEIKSLRHHSGKAARKLGQLYKQRDQQQRTLELAEKSLIALFRFAVTYPHLPWKQCKAALTAIKESKD